jgi:hypothetical protein
VKQSRALVPMASAPVFILRGALRQHDFVLALMQHDFVLARIRLTRMAAERGPILSGACGQMGVFHKSWLSK